MISPAGGGNANSRACSAGSEEAGDEGVRSGGRGAMLGQEEGADKEWIAGQFDGAHDTFRIGRRYVQCASAQGIHVLGIYTEVAEVFFLACLLPVNLRECRAGLQRDRHGAARE